MHWNDDRVDRMIGTVLRTGVLSAAAIVLLAGAGFLLHSGSSIPNYHSFRGEPAELRSIFGIIEGALHGRPLCIIQFGLLALIATPIIRVAFSVFAFAVQRDRMYAIITSVVFLVLLASLTGLVHPPH
ncbi:MAG TPA: DUF1634 domain-containing protein [Bryobacteraceae bacterium]|nr:DUF1634 domain-containing protein [Bryobacteraceae bacterium]